MWSQYSWDYRDPNDLNFVDFGDNKVLLYNAIGLGLVLLLSDKEDEGGSSHFSLSIEYSGEYRKEPLSQYYKLNLRRSIPFRKFLHLGGEVNTSFVNDQDRQLVSIGFSPFFTWNIIKKPRFRLAYDNGVGPVLFSSAFPEGGTAFNFYTYYGIEMESNINNIKFTLGVRNTHISNADIKGRERNPSFDGLGFYITICL